jgi:hypothetical protein
MLVQVPCQTQKRDETGMSRWKRAETASGMERIAPVAWSESPQWVERFAPLLTGGMKRFALPRHAPGGSPPRLAQPHRLAAASTGPTRRRHGPRP